MSRRIRHLIQRFGGFAVARFPLPHDGSRAVSNLSHTYGPLDFLSLSSDPEHHFYTWPNGQRTMGGDPLDWIRAHARTVKLCLELTEALQRNSARDIDRLVTAPTRGFAKRGTIEQESVQDLIAIPLPWWKYDRGKAQPNPSPTTRARILRATLINQNISRIHRFLKVNLDGTEQSFFAFGAQIEAVYWHLANVVDGGIVARCKRPGCGALFIQRHRSQEYCAPRYGQRESPCALWVRQRRLGGAKGSQRIATDSKTAGPKTPQVGETTTKKARQSPRRVKRA
jgi:hypothetical protein